MLTEIGVNKYGMPHFVPYGDGAGAQAAANGAITGGLSKFDADSPFAVLLAIIAVTFGLAAFGANARVGKFSASVKAGS